MLCPDASRLARNGRDGQHLPELCGLLEARVIDHDDVYNPCKPHDRLLLGRKGSSYPPELMTEDPASYLKIIGLAAWSGDVWR